MTATLRLEGAELICEGDWRLPGLGDVEARLPQVAACPQQLSLNGEAVVAMDLSGARVLRQWHEAVIASGRSVKLKLTPRQQRLFELVSPVSLSEAPSVGENPLARLGRISHEHARELSGSLACS